MDVTWLHSKILQSQKQNAVLNKYETDTQKKRSQTGIRRWATLSSFTDTQSPTMKASTPLHPLRPRFLLKETAFSQAG